MLVEKCLQANTGVNLGASSDTFEVIFSTFPPQSGMPLTTVTPRTTTKYTHVHSLHVYLFKSIICFLQPHKTWWIKHKEDIFFLAYFFWKWQNTWWTLFSQLYLDSGKSNLISFSNLTIMTISSPRVMLEKIAAFQCGQLDNGKHSQWPQWQNR